MVTKKLGSTSNVVAEQPINVDLAILKVLQKIMS